MADSTSTPGQIFTGIETSVEETVVTAAGLYPVYEDPQSTADALAGVRYTDVTNDFVFVPGAAPGRAIGASVDWVDSVIGGRVRH